MVQFGQDADGLYKMLDDGRVMRITPRIENTLLTISSSLSDQGWLHGW